MSNSPDSAGARRPAFWHTCRHCGGRAAPQSILDSREGKSLRLLRCLNCDKTDWMEER